MKFLAGFLAAAAMLLAAGAAAAQTATGDWIGTLVAGPAQSFHLGIHIRKSGAGLAGTLDDVTRAAAGLALSDVAQAGDTLSFKVAIAGAPVSYTAKWDAAAGG